jgi:hypothetical protein
MGKQITDHQRRLILSLPAHLTTRQVADLAGVGRSVVSEIRREAVAAAPRPAPVDPPVDPPPAEGDVLHLEDVERWFRTAKAQAMEDGQLAPFVTLCEKSLALIGEYLDAEYAEGVKP